MFPQKIHQHIYFWSAIIMVFGMPLGEFFMSVGSIAFVANWLLEGRLKFKVKTAFQNKIVVSFLLLLLIHLLGIIWTNNISFALHLLKIKAPFFLLPFCFASQPIFTKNQVKQLLFLFIGATLISAIIGVFTYFKLSKEDAFFDVRDISIFISHIRQSLMVVFSIVILFYYNRKQVFNTVIFIVIALFFVSYLILLQSLTGLSLLLLLLVGVSVKMFRENRRTAVITTLIWVALGGILVFLSKDSYQYYFIPKDNNTEEYTAKRSLYAHNVTSKQLENGHYVWRNLAEQELKDAWEKRSNLPYFEVNGALIRFITSLGEPKDAAAVNRLSISDIKLIEKGITSRRNLSGLTMRLDDVFFEIASYIDNQNPSDNSISQRLLAWELGEDILSQHKLLGTGTGGTKAAYEEAYNQNKFTFNKRIRSHNQFLTFFLSFGLIGGSLCLLAFIYPLFALSQDKLFIVFYTIVLFSFLSEDTLETQPGVLFVAFFLGLFINSNLVLKAKA